MVLFRQFGFMGLLLAGLRVGSAIAQPSTAPEKFAFRRTTEGLGNRLLKTVLDSSQAGAFWVNGHFNPYLIRRDMSTAYPSTHGGTEALSFAPYPNLLSSNANTLQPTLLIRLGGRPTRDLDFSVDYGLFYTYDADKSHKFQISNQSLLLGQVAFRRNWGVIKLTAGGGVMPLHFSALTLSNRYLREGRFDRVPWEYHSNSQNRNAAYFESSLSRSDGFSRTAAQGFYLEAYDLPGGLNSKLFFGRTQLNLFPSDIEAGTPSTITAFQIGKSWKNGNRLGIQGYQNHAWISRNRSHARDLRRVVTLAGEILKAAGTWSMEAGMANLENPFAGNTLDAGGYLKYSFQEGTLPFGIRLFAMGSNFVCLESEVYNANPIYRQGGFSGDTTYDNFLYQGYLNPAGSMASNRMGLDLYVEKKAGPFSISLGHQTSAEIQKSGPVLSFAHMVNGFSRSRFAPWQQYTGPYGRIGNRFRMSIERVRMANGRDSRKFMNSSFLDIRYRFPLGRLFAVLSSYSGVSVAGTGLAEGYFNPDDRLLQTACQELEASVPVLKQLTLVCYAGWEFNKAGAQTETSAETGNPLNQRGTGWGVGFDFEVAEHAGLFVRHRWMEHKDRSFLKDEFKGQETVVEIKISF